MNRVNNRLTVLNWMKYAEPNENHVMVWYVLLTQLLTKLHLSVDWMAPSWHWHGATSVSYIFLLKCVWHVTPTCSIPIPRAFRWHSTQIYPIAQKLISIKFDLSRRRPDLRLYTPPFNRCLRTILLTKYNRDHSTAIFSVRRTIPTDQNKFSTHLNFDQKLRVWPKT